MVRCSTRLEISGTSTVHATHPRPWFCPARQIGGGVWSCRPAGVPCGPGGPGGPCKSAVDLVPDRGAVARGGWKTFAFAYITKEVSVAYPSLLGLHCGRWMDGGQRARYILAAPELMHSPPPPIRQSRDTLPYQSFRGKCVSSVSPCLGGDPVTRGKSKSKSKSNCVVQQGAACNPLLQGHSRFSTPSPGI